MLLFFKANSFGLFWGGGRHIWREIVILHVFVDAFMHSMLTFLCFSEVFNISPNHSLVSLIHFRSSTPEGSYVVLLDHKSIPRFFVGVWMMKPKKITQILCISIFLIFLSSCPTCKLWQYSQRAFPLPDSACFPPRAFLYCKISPPSSWYGVAIPNDPLALFCRAKSSEGTQIF